MPRVSVIIPTYNAAAMVTTAVESVLGQTYTDLELIVVDDGSTDDTCARLSKYGRSLQYLYQPNQERAVARNLGIAAASGEYLAFLDADDFWAPNKLEQQLANFDRLPHLGWVSSWAGAFEPSGQVQYVLGRGLPADSVQGSDLFEHLLLRMSPPTSATVARADLVRRAGAFDEELVQIEDWDLWLRLAASNRAVVVPEMLAFYRLTPGYHPDKLAAAGVAETGFQVLHRALRLRRAGRSEADLEHLERRALSEMSLFAGLILLAVGEVEQGRQAMEAALDRDPILFEGATPRAVAIIADFALNLRALEADLHEMTDYCHTVFGCLPARLMSREQIRRAVLRTVTAGFGFRHWSAGNLGLARRLLFNALASYPELGLNRGTWSILVRSLFGQGPVQVTVPKLNAHSDLS